MDGRKVSPYCNQCWDEPANATAFTAKHYSKDVEHFNDGCHFGFGNVLHFVIADRGWYRDQHAFEMLESDLRLHLITMREQIEKKVAGKPQRVRDRYIRVILRRKVHELQRTLKHQARTHSYAAPENILTPSKVETVAHAWGLQTDNDVRISREVRDEFREARKKARTAGGGRQTQKPDLNDDESQHAAQIAEAGNAAETSSLKVARKQAAQVLVAEGEVRAAIGNQMDFIAATKKSTSPESTRFTSDPNLLIDLAADAGRALLTSERADEKPQEQDSLSASIAEARREIETDILAATPQCTSDREFFTALARIPADEQQVIRLRYCVDGRPQFRDGRPRPRVEIVRELRDNGGPYWSEADLRRLERMGIMRLRGLLKRLPPVVVRGGD